VVSEPDAGVYDSINKGWRMATGTWCEFLNARDVLADPHVLTESIAALGPAPDPWVVARTIVLDASGAAVEHSASIPLHRWLHLLGLISVAHPSHLHAP
jgi:GT2 family glycosyltransferase